MLLRDAEVAGRRCDVRVTGTVIATVGPGRPARPDESTVDADGGALIPGLHDHHVHVLALAAAHDSVRLAPPLDRDGFAAQLRRADAALPARRWLRGVGYHESVAGPIDRWVLDALVGDRPVRVQHRTGARWTLNSPGIHALGLDGVDHPGVERDAGGRPTGRLHRLDAWLRERLPPSTPDLARVGARLASLGVTGVTDATPFEDPADLDVIAAAARAGVLPQRVVVTGGPALLGHPAPAPLVAGPVKVVLDDPGLPDLDRVIAWFRDAHRAGRAVAVHCVTRAALAFALAAWSEAGAGPGDRVEHAAVVPPDLADLVRRTGLTVVTNPGFVADRGDAYLSDVDSDDRPHLYPARGLLERGIPLAAGTDAPFGEPDPWYAIRAAVERRTPGGIVLGPDERLPAERALRLFLGHPGRPGGPPRTVTPGQPADLVLLDSPMSTALADPSAARVRLTIRAGHVIHGR